MPRLHRAFLAVLTLSLALSAKADANFIGDAVNVESDFSGFINRDSATVVTPAAEFLGFGFNGQYNINVEASSISILINNGFGGAFSAGQFTGLRFTSLDSRVGPISGVTLAVNSRLATVLGADNVSFGSNSATINFNPLPQASSFNYLAGDVVTLNFTFSPAAVPEPSSLAMCGVASLGGLGAWARRRRNAAAA